MNGNGVFVPADAAKRLTDLATTVATAPIEQIVVLRLTLPAAAQLAADLAAIAKVVGALAPPQPVSG